MCLFSFEQGNCVLPTANGTWASKDLSSVWNIEPTISPQVFNLPKYMLSPSLRPNLSWLYFTSQLVKSQMDYSRRKEKKKKAVKLKRNSNTTLFWVGLIIKMLSKVRQYEIKWERVRERGERKRWTQQHVLWLSLGPNPASKILHQS